VDGVSLHTIMAFHISALEDPELMHQYTQFQNPDACNEVQCANWDRQICSEEYLSFCYEGAWPTFEIYRKRFPSSPLVGRYLALFPDVDFQNLAEGPFMQTCEFRKVEK